MEFENGTDETKRKGIKELICRKRKIKSTSFSYLSTKISNTPVKCKNSEQ